MHSLDQGEVYVMIEKYTSDLRSEVYYLRRHMADLEAQVNRLEVLLEDLPKDKVKR